MHWAISRAPNYLIFNMHLGEREKILSPSLRYFKNATNRIIFQKPLRKSCHTAAKLKVQEAETQIILYEL